VETILERMRRRGRATDAVSAAELRAALEREWGRNEPEDGQQVGPTMALADITIDNNGALADLEARVDEVLAALGA
jgi:dephospho-CoA kinase